MPRMESTKAWINEVAVNVAQCFVIKIREDNNMNLVVLDSFGEEDGNEKERK